MKGSRTLGRLPKRFQWTVHNVVAHPVSELIWQVGISRSPTSRIVQFSDWIHDRTVPLNVGPPRGVSEPAASGPGGAS